LIFLFILRNGGKAVSLTATVLRNGAWQEIPRREVVPDDVIRLAAGDMIPADARLNVERRFAIDRCV